MLTVPPIRRRRIMQLALLCGLAIALIGSGIWVAVAKHESRLLFAELEELNRERDRLQVDWGRLQLEQSAYATHSLIESTARERMQMRAPQPSELVIVSESTP